MTKYRRMNQNKMFGGVLSGLAYSLGAPTWIVRLIFVALTFIWDVKVFGSSLVFIYFIVAIFAPKYDTDPANYKDVSA